MVVHTNLSHNPGSGVIVRSGGDVYLEDCQVTRNGQYAINCAEEGEGEAVGAGGVVQGPGAGLGLGLAQGPGLGLLQGLGREGVEYTRAMEMTVVALAHCEVGQTGRMRHPSNI